MPPLRGIHAATSPLTTRTSIPNRLLLRQPARTLSSTPQRHADFAHVVVGAGVVGLSIARALQAHGPTLLLERHAHPGTETSSRNSEVVHAGLYYGHGSLKTALCLRGKSLLYAYCAAKAVPIRRTGKWLVAQDGAQAAALEHVAAFAREVGDGTSNGLGGRYARGFWSSDLVDEEHAIPLRRLTAAQCAAREPDVRAAAGALESASTGIVDSHALMQALLGDFEDAEGTAAFANDLLSVAHRPAAGPEGEWEIWTAPAAAGAQSGAHTGAPPAPAATLDPASIPDATSVTSDVLVNAAGLSAIALSNAILPPSHHITPAFAKGTYYSYALSHPKPSTLIYPAPVPGHGGLGTHLTLDLAGRIRFGPDVEWVSDARDLSPNADPARLRAALDDIKAYLPGIEPHAVTPDYCGIRPKLARGGSATAGAGFQDFHIKRETEAGRGSFVNLLGIESPGLTSALAIGDYVADLLYKK